MMFFLIALALAMDNTHASRREPKAALNADPTEEPITGGMRESHLEIGKQAVSQKELAKQTNKAKVAELLASGAELQKQEAELAKENSLVAQQMDVAQEANKQEAEAKKSESLKAHEMSRAILEKKEAAANVEASKAWSLHEQLVSQKAQEDLEAAAHAAEKNAAEAKVKVHDEKEKEDLAKVYSKSIDDVTQIAVTTAIPTAESLYPSADLRASRREPKMEHATPAEVPAAKEPASLHETKVDHTKEPASRREPKMERATPAQVPAAKEPATKEPASLHETKVDRTKENMSRREPKSESRGSISSFIHKSEIAVSSIVLFSFLAVCIASVAHRLIQKDAKNKPEEASLVASQNGASHEGEHVPS